jgi:CRP-like cAMP-binding protein
MGGGSSILNDALLKSPFSFYLTPEELKKFQKCFLVEDLKAGEQLKFAAQLSADEMKRRNTRKQRRTSLRTSFTEARSSLGSSFTGINVLAQEKDSRTSFRDASGDFVELCVVSHGGLTITAHEVVTSPLPKSKLAEGLKGEGMHNITDQGPSLMKGSIHVTTKQKGDVLSTSGNITLLITKHDDKDKLVTQCNIISTATVDTTLLRLQYSKVARFKRQFPEAAAKIIAIIDIHPADILSQLPFMQYASMQELLLLSQIVHLESYKAGEVLFRKGDREAPENAKFFVVLKGTVNLVAEKEATILRTSSLGQSVTSSLTSTCKRSMDVVRNMGSGRNMVSGRNIGSSFLAKRDKDGNVVAHSTSPLQSKSSSKSLLGMEREYDVITTFGEGMYFGEMAVMSDLPRTGTASCKDDVLCYNMNKKEFLSFMSLSPIVKREVTSLMQRRMMEFLLRCHVSFLAEFSREHLLDRAKVLVIHPILPAGTVIIRQGDVGETFYILLDGEVEVSITGEDGITRIVGRHGSDLSDQKKIMPFYFGMLAWTQADSTRVATVTASKPTVLLSMNKNDFRYLFDGSEAMAKFNIRLLGTKISLTNILDYPDGCAAFKKFLQKEFALENMECLERCRAYRKIQGFGPSRGDIEAKIRTRQGSINGKDTFEPTERSQEHKRAREKSDEEARGVDALLIYDEFISDSAAKQVNIKGSVRVALDNAMQERRFPEDLFQATEHELIFLMERDNFGRWKQTVEFSEFLASCGTPYEM